MERAGDRGLLDRIPVDQGLLLVLEGRPVHASSPGAEAQQEGACHFAGEHTSIEFQGYLNGAVESGERAAAEIVAALKKARSRQFRLKRGASGIPWFGRVERGI